MNNISGCWQNGHPVRIVKLFEGGGSRMKKDREIQKKTDGREKTVKMAAAGLFAAMIAIMTAYICHIPYGANGGLYSFWRRTDLPGSRISSETICSCGGSYRRGSGRSADGSHVGAGNCDHKNADCASFFGKAGESSDTEKLDGAFRGGSPFCSRILSGRRNSVRVLYRPGCIFGRQSDSVRRQRGILLCSWRGFLTGRV